MNTDEIEICEKTISTIENNIAFDIDDNINNSSLNSSINNSLQNRLEEYEEYDKIQFELYKKAAEKGHIDSIFILEYYYDYGNGTETIEVI